MSASFFVESPETTDTPVVYDYDQLPEALETFLRAVREQEWARLDWSS